MADGSATTTVGGFTIKASTGVASNGITTTVFIVSRGEVQGFANDVGGIYSAAVRVQERSFGGVVDDVNSWVADGGAAALQAQSEANAQGSSPTPVPELTPSPPTPPALEQPQPPPPPTPQLTDISANDDSEPPQRANLGPVSGGTAARQTTSVPTNELAGARLYNPLSQYSSYSYTVSLYMLSPEAVNYLNVTGDSGLATLVNGGGGSAQAYLVAQSGGSAKEENRAITNSGIPGKTPGNDYYIDDLSFTVQTTGTNNTGTGTFNTDFKFNIIEPYGYGFISRLTEASRSIVASSPIAKKREGKTSPYDQPFVLVIRFYGYDKDGNIISGSTSSAAGEPGTTDSRAGYERYFNIKITNVSFTLDGRAATYKVEATGFALQVSYGKMRGLIPKAMTVTGATVNEMLQSLLSQMSAYEQELIQQGSTDINTYRLNILSDEIKNARVLTDAQYDQNTTASSVASSVRATIKSADQAKTINQPIKKISLKEGTPVIKAIDNIIAGSTFVTDSLTLVATGDINADIKQKAPTKNFEWYCIVPTVDILGIDEKRNDWCYNIVYNIRKFQVPYIRTPYAKKSKYYGPHKRYEYYFTGLNSEIIDYKQTYNNLYFVTTIQNQNSQNSVDLANSDGVGTNTKTNPSPPAADKTTSVGINRTTEISNQLRTALYSVGDQAEATITIAGDPDFLMQSVTSSAKSLNEYVSDRYGAGYTIDPNGGQVFIEINFQESTDYASDTGIMDIKETIAFYQDPAVRNLGIKGLVYRVLSVTSKFSGGRFTQQLNLSIVTSSQLLDVSDSNAGTSSGNSGGGREISRQSSATDPGEIPGITVSDRNQTDPGYVPGFANSVVRKPGVMTVLPTVSTNFPGSITIPPATESVIQRAIGGIVDDDAGRLRNRFANALATINNARE